MAEIRTQGEDARRSLAKRPLEALINPAEHDIISKPLRDVIALFVYLQMLEEYSYSYSCVCVRRRRSDKLMRKHKTITLE